MNNFNNSRQQPLPQGGGLQPQGGYSAQHVNDRIGYSVPTGNERVNERVGNYSVPTQPNVNQRGRNYSVPTHPNVNQRGGNYSVPTQPNVNQRGRNYSVPTQPNVNQRGRNYLNPQLPPLTQQEMSQSQMRYSHNNAVPIPVQQQYQNLNPQQMYQMSANNTATTPQHIGGQHIYQSPSGALVAPPSTTVNVTYTPNNSNNMLYSSQQVSWPMTNNSSNIIVNLQDASSSSLISVTNQRQQVVPNNHIVSTQHGRRQSTPHTRVIPIQNQVSSNVVAGSSQPSLAQQHQQLQQHILGQPAATPQLTAAVAISQLVSAVGATSKGNNAGTGKRGLNTGQGGSENDGEETGGEEPVVNNTIQRIDDDISIVSETAPRPLPHMRCHCPRHSFTANDVVVNEILGENSIHCDKCYCYICDKKAAQCEKWTDSETPHCNAHPGASCWKARRNLKMETMIPKLPADLRTPQLLSGEKEMEKMVIDIRQAYIDYRKGKSCLPEDVPCCCHCHTSNLSFNPPCAQCKGVHDLKKQFNYHPVRVASLIVITDVMRVFKDMPMSALVAVEGIVKELCTHRPADFNHATKQAANPDVKCQCNTPAFIEENITSKIMELCTKYDVGHAFIKIFDRELKQSLEPLQIRDICNPYMTMRHWNNILLRAVLNGQNTSGRLNTGSRNGDILRETIDIIKWRIFRLEADEKYLHVVRYLKVVKVQHNARLVSRHWLKEAMVEVERTLRLNLARLGRFKELCYHFADDEKCPMANEKPDDLLKIFSLMGGKNLPNNVPLLANNSFNAPFRNRRTSTTDVFNLPTEYKIEGKDERNFILLYLMAFEKNTDFAKCPKCVIWFGAWCNRDTHINIEQRNIKAWVSESNQLVIKAKTISVQEAQNFAKLFDSGPARDNSAVLFSACLILLQFFIATGGKHLEEMIKCFQNNEWALFYLVSQPNIIRSGQPRVIEWFSHFFSTHKDQALSLLTQDNLKDLVTIYNKDAVFKFFKIIIKEDWTNRAKTREDVFQVIYHLCKKLSEKCTPGSAEGKWLAETVMTKSIDTRCYLVEQYKGMHFYMARTLCLTHSLNYLSEFGRFNHDLNINNVDVIKAILKDHVGYLRKDVLKPLQINQLIIACISENSEEVLLQVFKTLNEQHRCYNKKEPHAIAEVLRLMKYPKPALTNRAKSSFFKLMAQEVNAWFICSTCATRMSPHWMTYLEDYHRISPRDANLLTKTVINNFLGWIKVMKWVSDEDSGRFSKCLQDFLKIFREFLFNCGYKAQHSMNEFLNCSIQDNRLKIIYIANVTDMFQKYINKPSPPQPSVSRQPQPSVSRQPPPQQSSITTTTPDPTTPKTVLQTPNIINLPPQPQMRIISHPNGSTPANPIRVEAVGNNVIVIPNKPQLATGTVHTIRQLASSTSVTAPKGRHNLPFTPSTIPTGRQLASSTSAIPAVSRLPSSTTTVAGVRQLASTIPIGRLPASSTTPVAGVRQLASTIPIGRQPASSTTTVAGERQLASTIPTGRQPGSSTTTVADGRQLASTIPSGRQPASSNSPIPIGQLASSSSTIPTKGRPRAGTTIPTECQLASTIPSVSVPTPIKPTCGKCNNLTESCKCRRVSVTCPRCKIVNTNKYHCRNCALGLWELAQKEKQRQIEQEQQQQRQQIEQNTPTEPVTTSRIGGSNNDQSSSSTAKHPVIVAEDADEFVEVPEDPLQDVLVLMTGDLPTLSRKIRRKRVRKDGAVVAVKKCKPAQSSASDAQQEKKKGSEALSMDVSTSSSVLEQTRQETEASFTAEGRTIISVEKLFQSPPNEDNCEKDVSTSIKENQQQLSLTSSTPSVEKVAPSETCCTSSSSELEVVSRMEDEETTQEDAVTMMSKEQQGEESHKKDDTKEKVEDEQEMDVVETKENEVVKTKENEFVETKENEFVETKENEVVKTKANEFVETKEKEVVETKENEVVETKENEFVEIKEKEVVETKENEVVETKENEVVETKENEFVETKENELGETKENELGETKENEFVETKEIELGETKENEFVETKEIELVETKEKEFVETKENELVETKEKEFVETQGKSEKKTSPEMNVPSKTVADTPEEENKVNDAISEQDMTTSEIIETVILDDIFNYEFNQEETMETSQKLDLLNSISVDNAEQSVSESNLDQTEVNVKTLVEDNEVDEYYGPMVSVSAMAEQVNIEGSAPSKEKQGATFLNRSKGKKVPQQKTIYLTPSLPSKASTSLQQINVESEKVTRWSAKPDTKRVGKSVRFADEDYTLPRSTPKKRLSLVGENKTTTKKTVGRPPKKVGQKKQRVEQYTTKQQPIEDDKTTTKTSVDDGSNHYPVVQQKPAARQKLQAPKMSGRQADMLNKFTKNKKRGAAVARRITRPLKIKLFEKKTPKSSNSGGNEAASSKNKMETTTSLEEIQLVPGRKRTARQEGSADVGAKELRLSVSAVNIESESSLLHDVSIDTPQQLGSNSVFNWNQTRKRKPGPASKTDFYVVNPGWDLTDLVLPPNLQMPLIPILSLSKGNAQVREKLAKEKEKEQLRKQARK